jgi:hypothetical protein
MDTKFFFFDGPNKPATARLIGPKFMASKMYQLSPPEVYINIFILIFVPLKFIM